MRLRFLRRLFWLAFHPARPWASAAATLTLIGLTLAGLAGVGIVMMLILEVLR